MAYNGSFNNGKPYNSNGYQGNHGGSGHGTPTPQKPYEPLDGKTYVEKADKIMKKMSETKVETKGAITTNQIRIILDLINEVYIPVKTLADPADAKLGDGVLSKLQYTKMKIAYQAGRDQKVKSFVNETQIMDHIDRVKTKGEMIRLAHYMEALVAYHKYHNVG